MSAQYRRRRRLFVVRTRLRNHHGPPPCRRHVRDGTLARVRDNDVGSADLRPRVVEPATFATTDGGPRRPGTGCRTAAELVAKTSTGARENKHPDVY